MTKTAEYRLTVVTTKAYGDGPSAGKTTHGTLVHIPDGTHWAEMPQVLEIALPVGTRPGAVYVLNLTLKEQPND